MGILPPINSDTMHIHSLLAAQSTSCRMTTHQLTRPIQGDKPAKQWSSVGPLVATTANNVSIVGSPFLCLYCHISARSPPRLHQRSWKTLPTTGPGSSCAADRLRQPSKGVGLTPRTHWLPAPPDRQTNKEKSLKN